jgi:C1A family cysteine protease
MRQKRSGHAFLLLLSFILWLVVSTGITYGQSMENLNDMIAREGLFWTAGETSVSDLSSAERQARLGGLPTPKERIDPAKFWVDPLAVPYAALPVSYDLRDSDLISPVKNQLTCGSCWAFSSTANIESLALGAGLQSTSLSEQAMLDCSLGTCDGWYIDTSFDFLVEEGTAREVLYPYTAVKDTCDAYPVAARLTSWQWINPTGQATNAYNDQIKSFIYTYQKPVSCRMNVYNSLFSYQSGIYHHLRRESIAGGHFVLIVGWGQSRRVKYWIVKNSWGTDWGEDGFFRIKMNDSSIGTYAIGAVIETE